MLKKSFFILGTLLLLISGIVASANVDQAANIAVSPTPTPTASPSPTPTVPNPSDPTPSPSPSPTMKP
ncbi:MAG: hypothetical protein ABI878_04490 [Acidobacteriota bacterium]